MRNIYKDKDKDKDEVEIVVNYWDKKSYGTWAIILGESDNETDSPPQYDDFVYEAEKVIKPNERLFVELPSMLISKYCAIPYQPDELTKEIFRTNLISNKYSYALDIQKKPGRNATDYEWEEYYKEDTSREHIKNISDDDLDLEILYFLLKKEDNKIFSNDIRIHIEMNSKFVTIYDDIEKIIIQDVTLFEGVSREDIDNKTVRFIKYSYWMKLFNII